MTGTNFKLLMHWAKVIGTFVAVIIILPLYLLIRDL